MKILKEASRKGPGKETFLPSPFKLRMAEKRGVQPMGMLFNLRVFSFLKSKKPFFILPVLDKAQGGYDALLGRAALAPTPVVHDWANQILLL